MENKDNINIAEILKDCPKGMKLYSPLFGRVELLSVDDACDFSITVRTVERKEKACFTKEGFYHSHYSDAECLLLPSSKMGDWSRFFKPGDVVIDSFYDCGVLVEEWADEFYTSFKASVFQLRKGGFAKRNKRVVTIDGFDKASDKQRDKFIADMEKFFGGKYNPETLQVEPVKPVCPFKPFDKVLVRDGIDEQWRIHIFSHHQNGDFSYVCLTGAYRYCIPYNEDTAQLLNTTDPYTEGGSE